MTKCEPKAKQTKALRVIPIATGPGTCSQRAITPPMARNMPIAFSRNALRYLCIRLALNSATTANVNPRTKNATTNGGLKRTSLLNKKAPMINPP